MDKEEPVGFSTWHAQRSGNIITTYVPNSIAEEFMSEAMTKSKIVIRIRGKKIETYTYKLSGINEAARNLACINDNNKEATIKTEKME